MTAMSELAFRAPRHWRHAADAGAAKPVSRKAYRTALYVLNIPKIVFIADHRRALDVAEQYLAENPAENPKAKT